jgi:hypothetical protein
MKFETLQIRWHDQQPVFSADFHQSGRLATGGADNTVKVAIAEWHRMHVHAQYYCHGMHCSIAVKHCG